ncbi:MAG: CAAX amino terminal protease self- immunity [Pelotomaculum sp. PtaB.Bin104]|nr:MAG: CAAX amino terminal protease self- immunity [Pelotomaculum sp. PtaB.Bin104]
MKVKLWCMIARHDISAYLLIVFGFGWLFYIVGALVISGHPEREPWLFLFQTPGAAMALIGGLVVRHARGGKAEVNAGWKQYLQWKQPWWLYVIAVALLPILAFGAMLIKGDQGTVVAEMWQKTGWSTLLLLPVIFVAQLPSSPLLEEYGWRGFLQQRLQAKYTALVSALIVGTLWGIHHVPVVVVTNGSILVTVMGGVIVSVLFAWLLNTSKGSMLLVVLFHASLNVAMMIAPKGYVFYILVAVTGLFISKYFGYKDLAKVQRVVLEGKSHD